MPEIINRDDARRKGLKRYFTGTACKNGHVCERYVGNKGCMECQRSSVKRAQWRASNREKVRNGVAKWRKANSDRIVAGNASWRVRNQDYQKKWYKLHPGATAEYQRKYVHRKKSKKYIALMEAGRALALDRGSLMDFSEAIEIFSSHDNAFDFDAAALTEAIK